MNDRPTRCFTARAARSGSDPGEAISIEVAIERDGSVTLTAEGSLLDTPYQRHAHDALAALAPLRAQLDAQGLRLLCSASRPGFQMSGMSSQMSHGMVGYLCRLGHDPERMATFKACEWEDTATTAECETYLRAYWAEREAASRS